MLEFRSVSTVAAVLIDPPELARGAIHLSPEIQKNKIDNVPLFPCHYCKFYGYLFIAIVKFGEASLTKLLKPTKRKVVWFQIFNLPPPFGVRVTLNRNRCMIFTIVDHDQSCPLYTFICSVFRLDQV